MVGRDRRSRQQSTRLLTGCHLFNDDEPSIDRSSGPLSEQRYQWTASPGIDLVTGPAVPIRAYMESRMDAQTMGAFSSSP
jgi:hypothetical protein